MEMTVQLQFFIFVCVFKIICILGKEVDLPLCPTNINYLPQSLPMHCRMPRSINYPMFPGALPNFTFPPLPPGFPSPDKIVPPLPFPMPPGVPGPPGLPGAPPMPMQVPMLPMPPPGPAHKVPVIVMPFYSPDATRKQQHGNSRHNGNKKRKRVHRNKKRLPIYYPESDTDTDTETSETDDSRYVSSDTSSSDTVLGWWGGRRRGGPIAREHMRKRRRPQSHKDFLTPIIQYVTKDGYVIFEKKISKDEANDWLQDKKGINPREYNDPPKDENKSKNEEDEAFQEYDSATTEAARKRSANAKTIDDLSRIRVRMHKNPHSHQRKPPAKNEQ